MRAPYTIALLFLANIYCTSAIELMVTSNDDSKVDSGGVCPIIKDALHDTLLTVRNDCYFMANITRNWFGAVNYCTRLGMGLAELSSQEEFEAVLEALANEERFGDYWFAANDLETEGVYTYITSGRQVTFGKTPRYGPNSDAADCIQLHINRYDSWIRDDDCFVEQKFICKRINPKADLIHKLFTPE